MKQGTRPQISLKIHENVLENVHRNVCNPFQHDIDPLDYTKNQAGFHHSHKYGFGLMDSWRLVNLAKVSTVQAREMQTGQAWSIYGRTVSNKFI